MHAAQAKGFVPKPAAAAFLGHGSPMNAIERNRYTAAWRALGIAAPRPRAVLVISAHWYVPGTIVTTMARPRTIHDFGGFPHALFDVRYPAPGMPELIQEVAEVVQPTPVLGDDRQWGLDHGAWSVLRHVYPEADVPVVQLSIDSRLRPEQHFELGLRLAALRQRGVMLLGSGNVVHNLRAMHWRDPDSAFDWARRFDEHARVVMTTRPEQAPALVGHPDYKLCVPTPEHFLPLLYLAGCAVGSGDRPTVLVDGYAFGSLSMTAYGIGVGGRH